MNRWAMNIMNRFGEPVAVRSRGGETVINAFIQPIGRRSECLLGAVTPAGWTDQRRWLYLGPKEVRTGDVLLWQGLALRVRSGRGFFAGGTLCHWQAVLEREREALCEN